MFPVFAMMVVDQKGGSACIECGRDFLARVLDYARQKKRPVEAPPPISKARHSDANEWRLEVWVGPFDNDEQAVRFCDMWRATTTPLEAKERRLRVTQLAKRFGRSVWTFCPSLYE
jgi:hypothetical protein